MNNRLIKAAAITASIAVMPAVGSAAEHSAAMNSCVSAFMASLAKHAPPLKLQDSRLIGDGPRPGVAIVNAHEFVLVATDAHDYHTVGRAICKLDVNGQVTQIEEVPTGGLLPL